jgi:hypothetical protein
VAGVSPYLVCSPASEDCTLVEATVSELRRREEEKRLQRQAAIVLRLGQYFNSLDDVASSKPCRSTTRKTKLSLPVLSPTTFILDSFDVAE